MKRPSSLRSMKFSPSLTRVTSAPGGAWARATLLAGMAASAAMSNAPASRISRLVPPRT